MRGGNNAKNVKWRLYMEQGCECAGCATPMHVDRLTRHHITPRSMGGNNHMGNLQLLCLPCHRRTHDGRVAV